MDGISSSSSKKIHDLIDHFFDKMSLQLLGEIPSLKKKKLLVFTSKPNYTLGSLFLKTLGTSSAVLPKEEDAIKKLLSTAEEYVTALRSKTKAQLVDKIDALAKESSMKQQHLSTVDIKNSVDKVLEEAKKHFKTIAEAESTKARNLGTVLKIAKVGASQGVSDPSVFFSIIRDGKVCQKCVKQHLLPDGLTPRVYKLSDVKFSYLDKNEIGISIYGQHNHCRCSLSFISPAFGFKEGKIAYISPEHDEYLTQRKFR